MRLQWPRNSTLHELFDIGLAWARLKFVHVTGPLAGHKSQPGLKFFRGNDATRTSNRGLNICHKSYISVIVMIIEYTWNYLKIPCDYWTVYFWGTMFDWKQTYYKFQLILLDRQNISEYCSVINRSWEGESHLISEHLEVSWKTRW